jgi:hypothetical protein
MLHAFLNSSLDEGRLILSRTTTDAMIRRMSGLEMVWKVRRRDKSLTATGNRTNVPLSYSLQPSHYTDRATSHVF